jgi:hypothetical protein
VRQGPPFDPGTRFKGHQVFVGEREVVFVFEGEDVRQAVQGLASRTSVWQAATAWRDCIGGTPRIADEIYSWPQRNSELEMPATARVQEDE